MADNALPPAAHSANRWSHRVLRTRLVGWPAGGERPVPAAALMLVLVVTLIGQSLHAFAAAGDITTVAGTGQCAFTCVTSGDGGPATSAVVASPYGVSTAPGRFFVSQDGRDAGSSRVRMVANGTISTFAGGVDPPLADGYPALQAALAGPEAVLRSAAGDIYIADLLHQRVRKISAASGVITTVAGSTACTAYSFYPYCQGATTGDGGQATAAQLNEPYGLAVDAAGDLYISTVGDFDPTTSAYYTNRVRRVDAVTGVITTVAGGGSPADGLGDGGPATSALITLPTDIAIDGHGTLFIADQYHHRIRRVDAATGIISTVAGNGTVGLSGDGGPATAAELSYPSGIAVDGAGNVVIADTFNQRIRKVDTAGTISTVAGSGPTAFQGGGGLSGDGGPATSALLSFPSFVRGDSAGDLFISDSSNERVREVDTTGTITTVAGSGPTAQQGGGGFGGDGGAATAAELNDPTGLTVDGSGNLYIVDTINNRVRKVDAAGIISTIAGGSIGDGFPATQASLDGPRGLTTDPAGDLLIADCGDKRVRKVDTSGVMSTVAGTASPHGLGDGGPATAADLECPSGLVMRNGSLYISDAGNNRIRKVDSTGVITTVAGTGAAGYGGDGGAATAAEVSGPTGLSFDGVGNMYIADTGNNRVRKVDSAGVITTVAGNGASGVGSDGAAATSVPVTFPTGVAFNGSGNMVIAESGFARIREVNAAGVISTIAGNGIPGYSGDGGPATSATLDQPTQLAYDGAGNLLFTDQGNEVVRSIAPGTPPPPPIATRKTADCGMTVMKNMTLSDDIGPCPGDGLVIGADGVTLNLNGHMILGNSARAGTHVGVRVQGHTKVKVTSGTVTGFDAGVAIIGGSANTVSNLTVTNNVGNPDPSTSIFGDGVVVFFSPGNSIIGNTLINNGLFDEVGVLGVGSDNNLIENNVAKGTDNGGEPFGPVGLGIILNPFLGADRPRDLSVSGNRVIGNQVENNGNAGISSISNINGLIQGNRVEGNGLENQYGGPAFPGNGIGVSNLVFADPKTAEVVDSNRVTGNGTNGIQVNSQGNTITNNVSSGNGGAYAGLYYFDLEDTNFDHVTFAPSCDSNAWSGNLWGSGGYFPACTSNGGHLLNGNHAPALGQGPLRPQSGVDPPSRRMP